MITLEKTYFFSSIIIVKKDFFIIKKSFFDYLLSFFHIHFKNQSFENQRTITYFQNYLKNKISHPRLSRILSKANVDFKDLMKKKAALTQDIAYKILLLTKDVKVEDVLDYIREAKEKKHSKILSDERLVLINNLDDLKSDEFDKIYKHLSSSIDDQFKLKDIDDISGRPTKFLSRIFFDYFLSIHERLLLCENNHLYTKHGFFEKLCKVIINRLLEVGTIIKAYNNYLGPNYYRVAARLITAEGCISYLLIPVIKNMYIDKVRVFRGSGFKPANIDALSFFITDLEKELGKTAFESCEKYEKYFQKFGHIPTEMGHSIGGCIAQYRASIHPTNNLYLFNSPGVPKKTLEAFNERVRKISSIFHLYIRRTKKDIVELAGEYHLGYNAPKNVSVDFQRYICQMKTKIHPHNFVFYKCLGKMAIQFGDLNDLNNVGRSYLETSRKLIGGNILAPFFKGIKKTFRFVKQSNASFFKGLDLENFKKFKWQTTHMS
ncbi:MAG: hypothetical protein K1060chlam5_00249 [Candidatus Anoxychlamydiales bacterium]|nr:hypothetical protein [Candidatus Anoxychlamydiales bacterium]